MEHITHTDYMQIKSRLLLWDKHLMLSYFTVSYGTGGMKWNSQGTNEEQKLELMASIYCILPAV